MAREIVSRNPGRRRSSLATRRLFRQFNTAIDAAYRTHHPRLLDALLAAKLDLARARARWPSYGGTEPAQ